MDRDGVLKPPEHDASGCVIGDPLVSPEVQEARRARLGWDLTRMELRIKRARARREEILSQEHEAMRNERRRRRELQEHARELAREIAWERSGRENRAGRNPWLEPHEQVSELEAKLYRDLGVD